MTITVIDKGRKLIEQRIALLGELQVMVGVQGKEADAMRKEGGATKGAVAQFIQFGTPNMPARPYMDIAIASIKQDMSVEFQRATSRAVSTGRASTSVSATLTDIGETAAQKIVDAIRTFPAPGKFDTGQTRKAVTYTVRDGDRIVQKGRPR